MLLRRPADPVVPRLDLERTRDPAEQRHPTAVRRLRDMPHASSEQTTESQVVVRVHEPVPIRTLRSFSRTGRTETSDSDILLVEDGFPMATPAQRRPPSWRLRGRCHQFRLLRQSVTSDYGIALRRRTHWVTEGHLAAWLCTGSCPSSRVPSPRVRPEKVAGKADTTCTTDARASPPSFSLRTKRYSSNLSHGTFRSSSKVSLYKSIPTGCLAFDNTSSMSSNASNTCFLSS